MNLVLSTRAIRHTFLVMTLGVVGTVGAEVVALSYAPCQPHLSLCVVEADGPVHALDNVTSVTLV